jgi:phospholipase C
LRASLTRSEGPDRKPTLAAFGANTVILIVWDDWGGWYDHVNPLNTIGIGYPNSGNNNGIQYVYGFRVPLLVVSTFAMQH